MVFLPTGFRHNNQNRSTCITHSKTPRKYTIKHTHTHNTHTPIHTRTHTHLDTHTYTLPHTHTPTHTMTRVQWYRLFVAKFSPSLEIRQQKLLHRAHTHTHLYIYMLYKGNVWSAERKAINNSTITLYIYIVAIGHSCMWSISMIISRPTVGSNFKGLKYTRQKGYRARLSNLST